MIYRLVLHEWEVSPQLKYYTDTEKGQNNFESFTKPDRSEILPVSVAASFCHVNQSLITYFLWSWPFGYSSCAGSGCVHVLARVTPAGFGV